MKNIKKLVALATFVAMLASATNVHAVSATVNTGGYGYQEARRAPVLAPAIALATIALVTVIIIALQNQGNSSHGHAE
jgi:hypothetical protein